MTFDYENFMLHSDLAKDLFHNHAKDQAIIDYHCHLDPKEIAEDHEFENITELWLGGDHYKWRVMCQWCSRRKKITGNASPEEKFKAWAESVEIAVGNPVQHWTWLELHTYFGYRWDVNFQKLEGNLWWV